MNIVLVRHALSLKNIELRSGDSEDEWPLTCQGIKAAEELSRSIHGIVSFDEVYCSTARASRDTAHIIAQTQGISVRMDERLRSINFGVISGLTPSVIRSSYPGIMLQIESYHVGKLHPKDYNIPGAETNAHFERRIRESFSDILTSDVQCICVVAHRSTITMLLNIVLDWPYSTDEGEYRVFDLPPLSMSIINILDRQFRGDVLSIGQSVAPECLRRLDSFTSIQDHECSY